MRRAMVMAPYVIEAACLLFSILAVSVAACLTVRTVEHGKIIRKQEEERTKRAMMQNAWDQAALQGTPPSFELPTVKEESKRYDA